MSTNPTPWQKASKSASSGSCVQVRRNGDHIEVSDSKIPDSPVLRFTKAEFDAWLDGSRKGEFDNLLEG